MLFFEFKWGHRQKSKNRGHKNQRAVQGGAGRIKNWLRSRSTIDLLGLREKLDKPHLKLVEFDGVGFESGEKVIVYQANAFAIGLPGEFCVRFAVFIDYAYVVPAYLSPN